MKRHVLVLVAFGWSTLWAAAAVGAPFVHSLAEGRVELSGAIVASKTGQANSGSVGPVSASYASTTPPAADGSAWGSVDHGVLRAFATAFADGGPFLSVYAQGAAQITDTLTLTSSSLPVGTPVGLRLALELSANLNGACGPLVVTGGRADASLNATSFLGGVAQTTATAHASELLCGTVVTSPFAVLTGFIGSEVHFSTALSAITGGVLGVRGTTDVSNTLFIRINPLSDFSYTTASGNSYLSNTEPPDGVPEPAASALLAAALIGSIGARLGWRRSV